MQDLCTDIRDKSQMLAGVKHPQTLMTLIANGSQNDIHHLSQKSHKYTSGAGKGGRIRQTVCTTCERAGRTK